MFFVALLVIAHAFINHVVCDDHYIPISYNNFEPSVNVSIGDQLFLVNLDTGSSNLAVPAQSCTMCTGPTPNPTTPSTACLSGNYTLPCGCTSGVAFNTTVLNQCPSTFTTYSCPIPFWQGALNPPPSWPGNISAGQDPVCQCVAANFLPGLQGPSSNPQVSVTSGSYGDQMGYIGPLLRRTVGSLGAH